MFTPTQAVLLHGAMLRRLHVHYYSIIAIPFMKLKQHGDGPRLSTADTSCSPSPVPAWLNMIKFLDRFCPREQSVTPAT